MATTIQCQKCRTSLKLDASLDHLNPASFQILTEAAPVLEPTPAPNPTPSAAARERREQYDRISTNAATAAYRHNVASTTDATYAPPDLSYIMLTESLAGREGIGESVQPAHVQKQLEPKATPTKTSVTPLPRGADGTDSLSQQLDTSNRLFSILSSRSDIDHPICSECTDLLLDGLQKRQAAVLRERYAYVDFLKQTQAQMPSEEESSAAKRSLAAAHAGEAQALAELADLEAEKARMESEIVALDAEGDALEMEEERFWQARNACTASLTAFQEERESVQSRLSRASKTLEALQRTNVYNDTFCVAHDGVFATINGLRLGRLPDHYVDWPEINAALGQTVLLLAVVAEKLGCKLDGFTLLPIGSTSKIVRHTEPKQVAAGEKQKKVHELYSSGDLPLGLGGLFQGKFDAALIELLAVIRLLGEFVEKHQTEAKSHDGRNVNAERGSSGTASGLRMPYRISKDKIGDVSIRMSSGSDEHWTKACKYTLTCCKFLLACASHVDETKSSPRQPRASTGD